jgi:acetylornithine deacetylase
MFDSPDDVINASQLLSFHRDIVQIESITGNEHRVGSFVTRFLESRGFTVVKQDLPSSRANPSGNRFNIYAHPANNPSPRVLLTSHIDTVPPFIPYSLDHDSTADPNSIRISGRGTVDAKASVAAQAFAALDTLQENPDSPLGLLFVVGEETGGDGMKHFSESGLNTSPPTFDTVIFGEPTELALASGHKGMLGFEVVAKGQAAHSGYPWLGRSAVSAVLPALSRLDKLGDIPADEGGLPSSPKFGATTVNIGRIDAGVATNVVPASARADVAVRLAAGTPDEARGLIRRAVRDATGGDEDVYVDFSTHLEAYSPQDLDADVAGFDTTTVNYGTDVPNLKIRGDGVKRYLYGPGSIHVAHGDHEAITVGQLEESVRGYRRLIAAADGRSDRA